MPRIEWVEEDGAPGEAGAVYAEYMGATGRNFVPDILKCFSQRPDFLRQVMAFSNTLHFSEGHLTRRLKEMIATYVSGLNRCPYWTDSHGAFLRSQGGDEEAIDALARGRLDEAPVTDAELALLRLVEKITLHPYRVTDEDVEQLRLLGWTDPQVAEMVYVTAMFAFFNRVADSFGIRSQGYGGPQPDWGPE
jgi:uncharacterized peroxidase-related enzyme